jgi:hypothetical protein
VKRDGQKVLPFEKPPPKGWFFAAVLRTATPALAHVMRGNLKMHAFRPEAFFSFFTVFRRVHALPANRCSAATHAFAI